jgi:hypothetical protein
MSRSQDVTEYPAKDVDNVVQRLVAAERMFGGGFRAQQAPRRPYVVFRGAKGDSKNDFYHSLTHAIRGATADNINHPD